MRSKTSLAFSQSRFLLLILLGGLSIFTFYGCDKNDPEEDARRRQEAYNRQLAIDTVLIKEYIVANNITNAQRSPYKSGLFYAVQTPGTGDSAALDRTMVTHYTLRNLQGKVLDTSLNPRQGKTTIDPYVFVLGSPGGGIAGYQEGVSLMRVGEKATFFVPSGLAYGAENRSPDLPANTVLIFDIELLEIR